MMMMMMTTYPSNHGQRAVKRVLLYAGNLPLSSTPNLFDFYWILLEHSSTACSRCRWQPVHPDTGKIARVLISVVPLVFIMEVNTNIT